MQQKTFLSAATELGCRSKSDGGAVWETTEEGDPEVREEPLLILD